MTTDKRSGWHGSSRITHALSMRREYAGFLISYLPNSNPKNQLLMMPWFFVI